MPEQFRFDQFTGNGCHVDGNERARFTLAELMQRFGNQLFAGAGLAIDHHRQVGLGHARDNPVNFLHRR